MAQSRALLVLLLLPPQLQLAAVLAVRAPGFGRSGAHSLSPEENEFVEEEPVLILSPEEPGPGSATINCPRNCACSQEGVVDCGGIDLREFPGDLPEHTNHLSLQNNQLEKIYPEELSRLHRLETLNLQNNRLTSRGLPEEAFEHLTNLNYLYLANNKVRGLQQGGDVLPWPPGVGGQAQGLFGLASGSLLLLLRYGPGVMGPEPIP